MFSNARGYNNPYAVPTVNGMQTAGGAAYNDTQEEHFSDNVFPFFPTSWLGRCQTPVSRLGAQFGLGVRLDAWDPRNGPRR